MNNTTPKQFARDCITIGGYNNKQTTGWDYIRANLPKLDYIFRAPEYIAQDGLKYKCLPYLIKDQDLTQEETCALETAWYLNNERTREEKDEQYKNEMIAAGFLPLSEELCQKAIDNNQKLHIIAQTQNDWATVNIDKIYTPKKWGDKYALLPPRARSRGHALYQFGANAFAKLI